VQQSGIGRQERHGVDDCGVRADDVGASRALAQDLVARLEIDASAMCGMKAFSSATSVA